MPCFDQFFDKLFTNVKKKKEKRKRKPLSLWRAQFKITYFWFSPISSGWHISPLCSVSDKSSHWSFIHGRQFRHLVPKFICQGSLPSIRYSIILFHYTSVLPPYIIGKIHNFWSYKTVANFKWGIPQYTGFLLSRSPSWLPLLGLEGWGKPHWLNIYTITKARKDFSAKEILKNILGCGQRSCPYELDCVIV